MGGAAAIPIAVDTGIDGYRCAPPILHYAAKPPEYCTLLMVAGPWRGRGRFPCHGSGISGLEDGPCLIAALAIPVAAPQVPAAPGEATAGCRRMRSIPTCSRNCFAAC